MTNRCFNSTCTVNFEIAGKKFSKMREYSAVVLNFPFWKPEEQELELVVVVVVMMGEGRGARMCLTNSMSTDLAYILSKRIQCDVVFLYY